ncbi:hypothetical protein GCM10025298_09790 [Natronobiforma cellulositropha]
MSTTHGAVPVPYPLTMIDTVKRFIGNRPRTLLECRHCGVEAEPGAERCENCGSSEIATYRFGR